MGKVLEKAYSSKRESSNLKTRKEKAITLIALVITIIVLLILAGVTVATLTGENGLLSKAQLSKERTLDAEQDEKETLNSIENEMSKYGTWERTGGTVTISQDEYNMLKNANSYLTTEKVVGTYVDGKPIYQKVFNNINTGDGDTNIVNITSLNVDTVVFLDINIKKSGNCTTANNNASFSIFTRMGIENNDYIALVITNSDWKNRTSNVIMKYTKTENTTPTE